MKVIGAFLEWLAAEFTEDRLAIAEKFRGRRHVEEVSASAYTDLLANADFVGGVIDGRGRLSYAEALSKNRLASWTFTRLQVNSINRPLLDALQLAFGGAVETMSHKRDKVNIRNHPTTLTNDGKKWTLGSNEAKNLLEWAKPKLPLSNSS